MESPHSINWKKYFFTLVITAVIFSTAIFLSNFFSNKKVEEIRSIQDKIAIDLLSSETQFSLLEESSCSDVSSGALSTELASLESKLSATENERGSEDSEVVSLKQYYSLLEIKDYLLMKRISEKCKQTPISILYFYSTDQSCPDCEREGYVLTRLRQEYPSLRVYSFDYNLDLSAVRTLIRVHDVKDTLPALVIGDKTLYGFKSVEDLENFIPELAALKAEMASSTDATRNATSTRE